MKSDRLEYSFGLHSSHLGDRVRKMTNPFTQQVVEAPIDHPLTKEECAGIRRILVDYYGAELDVDDEAYVWRISETNSVRLRSIFSDEYPPIALEVEMNVKSLSDEVLTFILRIARQGNLVFQSSISTKSPICLADEPGDPKIRQRWPDAKAIKVVSELKTWIETVGDIAKAP